MKKEYTVKIRSIKEWNDFRFRFDYRNTSEALNYIVDIIDCEEVGFIIKKSRKDKLILKFYCDVEAYHRIKMMFICRMGKYFEWIDQANHSVLSQKFTTT